MIVPWAMTSLSATNSKSIEIKSLSSYVNKSKEAFINDFNEACSNIEKQEYDVVFNNKSYTLKYQVDKNNTIIAITLDPSYKDGQFEEWKNLISKYGGNSNNWGNFLGTKFLGPESGLKQTIEETMKLAEANNVKEYRITPTFNPVSGVYFVPEYNKGVISYILCRSYLDVDIAEIASLLGTDYNKLHTDYYYISNQIKAWGMAYIYFAYTRDAKSNIFELKAIESKQGGTIHSLELYLNSETNKDIKKSSEIWYYHAQLLLKKFEKFRLYSTDTFGGKLQSFSSLDEAKKFLDQNKREKGLILLIDTEGKRISLVINKQFTYATINYIPANIGLTFDLAKDENVSFETQATGNIEIDWGDGNRIETKAGLNSGKILGDQVKIYGDIKSFDCSSSKLKAINLFELENLQELSCSGNSIESLDLKQCPNLLSLDCENNKILNLNLAYCPNLKKLLCSGNNISKLNLKFQKDLLRLQCNSNKLGTLSIADNSKLEVLDCSSNVIKSLDFGSISSLKHLIATDNQISDINLSNQANLERLKVAKNLLSSLDLSKNVKLNTVDISFNTLSSLLLPSTPMNDISEFICNNNILQAIEYEKIPNVMRLNVACNKLDSYVVEKNNKIRDISIYGNKIDKDNTLKLANSIYSRKDEDEPGHLFIISNTDTIAPQISATAFELLKSKNWDLYKVIINDGNVEEHKIKDEDISKYLFNDLSSIMINKSELSFAPNPADKSIHFSGQVEDVKIYSLSGDMIMKRNHVESLDVDTLPNGTYLMTIDSKVFKLIVKH